MSVSNEARNQVFSTVTAKHTAPTLEIWNTTDTNDSGGRIGKILFKGEQSGGAASYLAALEVSHDGTGNDEKGKVVVKVNDGNDGNSPTERMRIDSSGNMGIGTSSVFYQAANRTSLSLNGVSSAIVALGTGGTQKAYIYSDGTVFNLLNDAAGLLLIGVAASQKISFTIGGTEVGRFDGSASNDFYTNDGTVSSLSDKRLKKILGPVDDGLETLKLLRPVKYQYVKNSGLAADDGKVCFGFVADEVEEVAPHYVGHMKGKIDDVDCDIKTLSVVRMVPMIVKAIQELSRQVEEIARGQKDAASEIEKLKDEIAILKDSGE
jgi:hypothetical protein